MVFFNKGTTPVLLFGGSLVINSAFTLGNVGDSFATLDMADMRRWGLDFAMLGGNNDPITAGITIQREITIQRGFLATAPRVARNAGS